MLGTWIENVQRVGITNAMVVALDETTKKSVIDAGMESMLFTMKVRKFHFCQCSPLSHIFSR